MLRKKPLSKAEQERLIKNANVPRVQAIAWLNGNRKKVVVVNKPKGN